MQLLNTTDAPQFKSLPGFERIGLSGLACLLAASVWQSARAESPMSFERHQDRVSIAIRGQPFADYVFSDPEIKRPFLTHVHAPGGPQVTRRNPPVPDQDATDHATMHPGIWLALGDLAGVDFWRNKGLVEHREFVERPVSNETGGHFVVRNHYRDGEHLICTEICRMSFEVQPSGCLIDWDSTFRSTTELAFGDQEEMGLGVRMATLLTARSGGEIINSEGLRGEKQVWGQSADWCDYRGKIDDRPCGLLLMPSPHNFRRSWFHARDYGLLVANPFGQQAFTGQEKSRVVVPPEEDFRLRFGVLAHLGQIDAAKEYRDWVERR